MTTAQYCVPKSDIHNNGVGEENGFDEFLKYLDRNGKIAFVRQYISPGYEVVDKPECARVLQSKGGHTYVSIILKQKLAYTPENCEKLKDYAQTFIDVHPAK